MTFKELTARELIKIHGGEVGKPFQCGVGGVPCASLSLVWGKNTPSHSTLMLVHNLQDISKDTCNWICNWIDMYSPTRAQTKPKGCIINMYHFYFIVISYILSLINGLTDRTLFTFPKLWVTIKEFLAGTAKNKFMGHSKGSVRRAASRRTKSAGNSRPLIFLTDWVLQGANRGSTWRHAETNAGRKPVEQCSKRVSKPRSHSAGASWCNHSSSPDVSIPDRRQQCSSKV